MKKETVSEKRGRGRPPRFPELEQMVRVTYPEVKTKRGIQDKIFMLFAVRLIKDSGDTFLTEFYTDPAREFPEGVLVEIGRLHLEDSHAALRFANAFPTSGQGVREFARLVRRHRTGDDAQEVEAALFGSEDEPNALRLASNICKCIAEYRKRFPNISTEFVSIALKNAEEMLNEEAE